MADAGTAWLAPVAVTLDGSAMAAITGRLVVVLSVSDPDSSAAWYAELLTMRERGRYGHPDGRFGQLCLLQPRSGLEIAPHAGGVGWYQDGVAAPVGAPDRCRGMVGVE